MATYKLSEKFIQDAMETAVKDIFRKEIRKKIIDDISKEVDSILDAALSQFVSKIQTYEDFGNQDKVFVINIDGVQQVKESLKEINHGQV